MPKQLSYEKHKMMPVTVKPYPANKCLHQLFETQAAQTPEATALVFEGETISYQQLNQRANQLAHYLQQLNVSPDVLVGLCVEPAIDMVVGLLAILKAGGAYVPLDPNYPQQRLSFILSDADAPLLITQRKLADRFPDFAGDIVYLDKSYADYPQTNPTSRVSPDNLAHILYTSGSTGKPKGVMGLHRVAVQRVSNEAYPIEADEVFCQTTSLNFIDSIWEIFAPLSRGLKSVLLPKATQADPQRLIAALASHRVTRLVFVPSLLRHLLGSGVVLAEQLLCVKYWISSGEPLPVSLARQFTAVMPHAILINLYGTSEVWDVAWHPFEATQDTVRVPIGKPLVNVEIYILNKEMQPVAPDEVGELYVGGVGLARGYHKRPSLTAEKFIPHPFSQQAGQRLYQTGDLARYRADGTIECLGRIDHQVKIRGFRIELGEIEAVLIRHAAVQECLVVAREERPDIFALAAYIIVKDNGRLPTDLRQFLSQTLPDYMIPAHFIGLAAFPLLPNGKINRQQLPAPSNERPNLSTTYVAPRTEMEAAFVKIWQKILHVSPIGVYDGFIELGGHSLLASQIIIHIDEEWQVNIPIENFFTLQTNIAFLADYVDTVRWSLEINHPDSDKDDYREEGTL